MGSADDPNRGAPASPEGAGTGAPYIGLRPFEASDRWVFHGRERDGRLLRNKLLAAAVNLFYAPSGVGKTSLLKALVIPDLEKPEREVRVVYADTWNVTAKDTDLAATLAQQIAKVCGQAVEAEYDSSENALAKAIERAADDSLTLVLILDQFEQCLIAHDAQRKPLARGLGKAVRLAPRWHLLFSLREEFLASMQLLRDEIPALFDSRYRLEHLYGDGARQAIEEPAKKAGRPLQQELVVRLEEDLRVDPNATSDVAVAARPDAIELPFLQLVCQQIWLRSAGHQITLADYTDIGGRDGVIKGYVEDITATLSSADRNIAARLFHKLAPRTGIKRLISPGELADDVGVPVHEVERILKHFEPRVLRQRPTSAGPAYELYHDAFIGILRPWREEQSRRRQVQRMWLVASAVVLILLAAGVWLWQVRDEQERIVRSLDRAQAAQALLTIDPVKALAEAVEAANISDTEQAHDVLRRALSNERSRLLEPGSPIVAAAFSADGKWLAAGTEDGAAQIWDVDANKPRAELAGHTKRVTDVAFSPPDGRLVATASFDRNVRLFLSDGRNVATLAGHDRPVQSVAFDASGRLLVSASQDGTTRVWDTETYHEVLTLGKQEGDVIRALFTPDGRRIVTVSSDGMARVWDVERGRLIQERQLQTYLIKERQLQTYLINAALSPNGKYLITTGTEGTASIWQVGDLKLGAELRGHYGDVLAAAFSPDGQRVVTAGGDNTAKVWNVDTGDLLADLRGHASEVQWAAFRADGNRVVTASADKTVRSWDIANATLPQQLKSKGRIVLSPDNELAATIGTDLVRVWSLSTGKRIEFDDNDQLRGKRNKVNNVAFSTDGKQLVTAGADNTARILDLVAKKQVATLKGHQAQLLDAAFSHDGKLVATASADKTWRVWDTESAKPLAELKDPEGEIYAIAFSPDGKFIATASAKTVRVWDWAQRKVLRDRHQGKVGSVAFSGNGRRVLTASADGTAKLWDWYENQQIELPSAGAIQRARFSPDGSNIVTVTRGTAQIWKATGKLVSDLPGEAGMLTDARFSANGQQIVTLGDDKRMAFPCDIWCQPAKDLLRFARERLQQISSTAPTATAPKSHQGE